MHQLIDLVQNIYVWLDIPRHASENDVGVGSVLIIFLLVWLKSLNRKKKTPKQISISQQQQTDQTPKDLVNQETAQVVKETVATSMQAGAVTTESQVDERAKWLARLREGLKRSRQEIWGKFEGLFHAGQLHPEQIDELEELLYMADIGPQSVQQLLDRLQPILKSGEFSGEALRKFLFNFLKEKMNNVQQKIDLDLYKFQPEMRGKTKVIMIVGVNGAGKTTTIGKLATKLTAQGANVFVGACDTFRAAAVDQLEVWCRRAKAQMIRAAEGSDPSGVAFETLKQALEAKADYCILDTAGRLHTKVNLMEELKKGKRVLQKLMPEAPHQVLLVLDAITGQNAIKQAQEFHKALAVTGLVFTKCDGSAKAGAAVSIVQELEIPIAYIGVGEKVEDLNVFNLDEYLSALINVDNIEPVLLPMEAP